MAFTSLMDFLMMGKHGFYVWSAYGFSFLVMAWLIWHTLLIRRQVYTRLHKRFLCDEERCNQATHHKESKTGGTDASC